MADETTKPGFKTPQFWLALIATIGGALTASGAGLGAAGNAIALGVSGLTAAGYMAYRQFKKSEDPKKPAWKTSEFWLAAATGILSILYASGLISDGSNWDKVIGSAAALLAVAGYKVVKPAK